MSKNKSNSLADLGNMVFSTNPNTITEQKENEETLLPSQQYLEAHFSKKGRNGKTVTLISGFEGTETALKNVAKMLKTKCGVGGSIKDQTIIIQGNYRAKIIEILQKEGYNVKRVGG